MNVESLASAERADLVAFVRTLSDDDWLVPSLCEGWRVRDVVAHVGEVDYLGFRKVVGRFVRARFSVDRFNAIGVEERSSWPVERLIDVLEGQVELGRLSRIRGGVPALGDAIVHHQDIRRPLGRPRKIPEERLIAALNFPDPFIAETKERMRDLSFEATDIDWSRGEGPVVRGPGEALMMAIAGRSVALDDLDGEGVDLLRSRV